jgi:alkyl hydroperoxide reductase subunit AhpC
MLGIGEKFPSFSLKATGGIDKDPDKSFTDISDLDFSGKWKVYFFWPADFTFVCPTEIAGFAKLDKQFQGA